MKEVLDFLREYHSEVSAVLGLIVVIIITCLKKKPVKVLDTVKEYITRLLPYCINKAEESDLKGEKKKIFALSVLYDLLKEFGYEEVYNEYRQYAAEQIEIILSTPHKKEVTNCEK